MQKESYPSETTQDSTVRIRDMEERQNILKDRVLLIGENLVNEKEKMTKEITELNQKIFSLSEEIRRIKLVLKVISDNVEGFARKTELEIMRKQYDLFQPLELARISDVKKIIENELGRRK